MYKLFQILMLVLLCFLWNSNKVVAGETTYGNSSIKKPLPLFKPKSLPGTPKVRIAGGTRGKEEQGFESESHESGTELYVLAPEELGFTCNSQPVLYWYVSKPVEENIELAVTDKQTVLLKTTLNGIGKSGIQVFNLADYHVYLKPGTKYRWSVAIINNPKQRSNDTFTSGVIMHYPLTESIKTQLAAATDNETRVSIFATEGIWYDELEAIQSWLKKSPNDQTAAKWRASFLEQAGLKFSD